MEQRQADGGQSMGLRERKRRATRDAIERAAIALVSERGYDNVTVAQICEASSVSQGTFFNYFRTKDAAIVGIGEYDLDADSVRAAFDRLMPCSMLHATLTLFLEVAGSFDWESDIAAQRIALVSETPSLMQLFLDNAFGFVSDFRTIVEAYTPNPVITVPMKTSDLGGLDSLLSMVQMPSGVPVACVAINGAKNAAILAVQILGTGCDADRQKIIDFKKSMAEA